MEKTQQQETGGNQAGFAVAQRSDTSGGQDNSLDAGGGPIGPETEDQSPRRRETEGERAKRYRAMVTGEFKDLFTADTQRIINERFKETRGLRETLDTLAPVLERLKSRYGVTDGDLAALGAALDREDERVAALLSEAAKQAAAQRERALLEDIRARGGRPAENGAGAQNGMTTAVDLERMSKAERAEIVRRAMRGETITFR